MADLERLESRLTELAPGVEWPTTPDLRAGVRRGIARARRRRVQLLILAATLAVALAGGAAAATVFELHGATIQRVPRLPSPSPSGTAPGPVGVRYDLGTRYENLAAAEKAAGFKALVPDSLGVPDEVYVRTAPTVLTLVYRPRASLPAVQDDPSVGALVMEASATVDRSSFGKLIGPGSTLKPVTVNGGAGFWIGGAPHGFFFYASGGHDVDHFRLAGDVLIWNQAGLVVRIESALDDGQATSIAGTMH